MTLEMLERLPTSALSERELLAGYAEAVVPALRSEPCACGGVIWARDRAAAIAGAVAVHNASTGHAAWAIAAGLR